MEQIGERIVHGKNCPKVRHLGTGFLHDIDDDGPYDVDGCWYCGRCHYTIAEPLPDPPKGDVEK
jgi:hypothetical protein